MEQWLAEYVQRQKQALDSIPLPAVETALGILRDALHHDRGIFIFGNGGSAANASHFVTDLGKGSSDKIGRRFRCLSLTDNVAWMTALGNDYAYDDIFVRQLENFARPGDVAIGVSVSGASPNIVNALRWAREHQLQTIALVGGRRGPMADIANHVIPVEDTHYGRVEDAHMGILHMLCYAFMERPEFASAGAR